MVLLTFVPTAVFAWKPGEALVPCGYDLNGDGKIENPAGGGPPTRVAPYDGPAYANTMEECNWNGAVALANNLLDFMIYMSVLIAVLLFAFAGFKYMTAGGDVGQIKQAHKIFKNAAIGFVLVLTAWLIVDTILSVLAKAGYQLSNLP